MFVKKLFSFTVLSILMLPLFNSSNTSLAATGQDEKVNQTTTTTTTTVVTVQPLSSRDMLVLAQRELSNRGYYRGPINGVLTAETRRALRKFQDDMHVAKTERLDNVTVGMLGIDRVAVPETNQVDLSTPAAIMQAQTILQSRGYYHGPVNGALTEETQEALKNFQDDSNLAETGQVDLATAQALGFPFSNVSYPVRRVYNLMSSDAILKAQMVLRDRGYYHGKINGAFNDSTKDALEKFQEDHGLKETKRLDEPTARMLGIDFDVAPY